MLRSRSTHDSQWKKFAIAAGTLGRRASACALPLFMVAMLFGIAACRPAAPAPATMDAADSKHTIVCTIGMITDLVERVAGDRADVVGLIPPGVDPHLFRPSRSDMATLMSADMIFYNGLLLEGRMTDALVRVATGGKRVHAVTEEIDESLLLTDESDEAHADPHVWMDPTLWAEAVGVIRDALIAFDPGGAADYESRSSALIEELRALHEYARQVLDTVPTEQRMLITAHDAFGYFGRQYGFEVVGIQGVSTESEAGIRHIESLVDLVVSQRIPAVFAESTVSDRNVSALVAGASAKGWTVRVGGSLFSDAMGAAGSYEGTYIGMIDHNVTLIARSLGGSAPPTGMQNRLSTIPASTP